MHTPKKKNESEQPCCFGTLYTGFRTVTSEHFVSLFLIHTKYVCVCVCVNLGVFRLWWTIGTQQHVNTSCIFSSIWKAIAALAVHTLSLVPVRQQLQHIFRFLRLDYVAATTTTTTTTPTTTHSFLFVPLLRSFSNVRSFYGSFFLPHKWMPSREVMKRTFTYTPTWNSVCSNI